MIGLESRVHLHLLDAIPAVVVAAVTDGLRARGLDIEVRGDNLAGGGDPVAAAPFLDELTLRDTATHVFLTSRALRGGGSRRVLGHASPERDVAIVSLPREPGESRFDASVASRVLKLVVHELGHLNGREHCKDPHCVLSHADSPAALDAQEPSPCARCATGGPAAELF